MAELEKKYSDYQQSECKDEQVIEVVDEKICPTCEQDPNFKLRTQWFEIPEAYLNKKVCEYHVRVYESEIKKEAGDPKVILNQDELERVAFEIAALKILQEFDKPINDSTRQQVVNSASVIEVYYNTGSELLGRAFLVATPAFNFDRIPSNDSDSTDQRSDQQDFSSGGEFIVQAKGLYKKLNFLKLTLATYGLYYSTVQHASDSFVIRQENDIVQRINYEGTKQKLQLFMRNLDDALSSKGYPKLRDPGFFNSKRAERIKFVFKSGGQPFEIKSIWVLPDDGCEKYEKLSIGPNNPLRSLDNAVIYNFLENIDRVYNDIVSRETMPWLEWTLTHFYPTYIVDRGDVEDLGSIRNGLECLLEDQLGLNTAIDSLSREIMSAFSLAEKEYNKQACREIDRLKEGSVNVEDPSRARIDQAAVEDRKKKMIHRYEQEFVNKFYDVALEEFKEYIDPFTGAIDNSEFRKTVTKKNLFSMMKQIGPFIIDFEHPTYKFLNKGPQSSSESPKRTSYMEITSISSMTDLKTQSKIYAEIKFKNMETAPGSESFREIVQQVQNSPHYHDAIEAARETFDDDNTFLGMLIKSFDGTSDISPEDLIPVIGLCGINKMGGKALECLVNGITFESFLDIIISKIFEYMELNTLKLFFNDLPYDFREKLNTALTREFGPNVNLADLFGIKMSSGGTEKTKDFVKTKSKRRRVKSLFEKYISGTAWTEEEVDFVFSQISDSAFEDIGNEISLYYDPKEKVYSTEEIIKKDDITGLEKTYKPERWIEHYIGRKQRAYLFSSEFYGDALGRINSSLYKTGEMLEGAYSATRDAAVGVYDALADFEERDRQLIDLRLGRDSLKSDLRKKERELSDLYGETSDTGRSSVTRDQQKFEQDVGRLESEIRSLNEAIEIENQKISELDYSLSDFKEDVASTYDRVENSVKQGLDSARQNFEEATDAVGNLIITDPSELNDYEQAQKNFEQTALGVKVDIVFDIVFDYLIEFILQEFGLDQLYENLKRYPAVAFLLDGIEFLAGPSCPSAPIIVAPDFLKTLKVDICDPTFTLTAPKLSIPSIDWRFQIQKQFTEIFREALIKLVSDLILKLVRKLLSTLEGALCNLIEAAGGLVAGAIRDGNLNKLADRFYDALNEAFCNDGDDPATSRKKAELLADALFSPFMLQAGMDPQGGGRKVADIIGSVATTREILDAMVGQEDNDNFNTTMSNAINILAPEMRSLLGSPNQVAYFFKNLGSHLSPDDRERIRALLEADIPNLPISSAICLTDDQLGEWNDLRNRLLQGQGLTPEQAQKRIDDLNKRAEDALGDVVDDLAGLGDGDGSGAIADAIANELNKDQCNPNNIINPTRPDPVTAAIENELTEGFFNNITTQMMRGMTGRNSVLGNAMADFNGRKEFSRIFLKFFNPSYGNSQSEWQTKYDSKSALGQFVMKALTENEKVIGAYPKTVGIIQREQILEDAGKQYNFSEQGKNVVYKFYDESEGFFSDSSFTQTVTATNNTKNKKSFNYLLNVVEKINNQPEVNELSLRVPVSVTSEEEDYMNLLGFQYKQNNGADIRKDLFNHIVRHNIPLQNKDYSDLYERGFEEFNKYLVELLLTDSRKDDGIPVGYRFGYVSDDLSEDSFKYYNPGTKQEYNKEESEKILGVFESSRVIALDPGIYGGRYSNPPFFIEPRQFSGWMELATKSFESPSGCEPKKPPLVSFGDIKTRVKDLSDSLGTDPRLTQNQQCSLDKPFHLLMDKKTKANMDGVVRTTLRTYVVEYFMKGYGLLSNLEMNEENFDQALFLYMTKKMKSEMYELGSFFSVPGRVTIVQEKYWFTFLEQCVEAYQRMIDVDGITPPRRIANALNSIQRGLDLYKPVDKNIKRKMVDKLSGAVYAISKPPRDYDPEAVMAQASRDPAEFVLQSVAYRLTTDEEEKNNYFDGGAYIGLTGFDVRFSSMRKLSFFQKIYFIALFEKEAVIIMSELLRNEVTRLVEIITDGLKDRPYYRSLPKSLFSLMPGSTSKVGTNDYYIQKQTSGVSSPGDVPEISQDSSSPPVAPADKPQFIIEKYARLVPREEENIPTYIRNRPQKYVGNIPLSSLSEFVSINLGTIRDNNISDFFGNLDFTYSGSMKSLLERGFTDTESRNKLISLNPELGSSIFDAIRRFITSSEFKDFNVIYDKSFLEEGDNPEPFGTTGDTGIFYGLRVSMVLPKNYFNSSEISRLRSDPNFMTMSRNEKSYLFDDNTFVIPLVTEEISVVDTTFDKFDPFAGTERYDLECLINKVADSPSFKIITEKLFNMKQCSSMLGIYCMETMMAAIGRKVDTEDTGDSTSFERAAGREADVEDEWDGTLNKFGKNFLRREFKSLYLSRTVDGLSGADDDDDGGFSLGGLAIGNPFDIFSFPAVRLPWWQKRRLRKKIYDANGMECADPKKDLQ